MKKCHVTSKRNKNKEQKQVEAECFEDTQLLVNTIKSIHDE